MLIKYTQGVVPRPGPLQPADEELQLVATVMVSRYRETFSNFQFHLGLQSIWELISHANKYIVRNEPWALAADPGGVERLGTGSTTWQNVCAC